MLKTFNSALFTVALLATCSLGCEPRPQPKTDETKSDIPQSRITREQAEEIAKKEVARRGWKEMSTQYVRFQAGVWTISLERLPGMPGGHAVIKIAEDGKVLEYIPGR